MPKHFFSFSKAQCSPIPVLMLHVMQAKALIPFVYCTCKVLVEEQGGDPSIHWSERIPEHDGKTLRFQWWMDHEMGKKLPNVGERKMSVGRKFGGKDECTEKNNCKP